MRPLRFLLLSMVLAGVTGCEDEPLKSGTPGAPLPPSEGVQAFIQVSDTEAQPGQTVSVYVAVQLGSENAAKLGSYTARLRFDPEALAWKQDVEIGDGLRVTNPNGSPGEVRFAGAAAGGFNELKLYEGVFEVKGADYMETLKLEIEELSATGLTDLQPNLKVAPQIFLRESAS